MSPLLRLDKVEVSYGAVQALRGIDLTVEKGSITALIGANGAGKSTTLMAISRIVPFQAGEIAYQGASLAGANPEEAVAQGIIQVPEGRRVFPRMSVRENLLMGAYLVNEQAVIEERMAQVLHLFPVLAERERQKAGTLSGGEQQMLALGRAMMAGPDLLLLDEPSLGLAPIIIQRIFDALKEINAAGTTILLVEQNAHLALETSDTAYVLENGSIPISGPSKDLAEDPRVIELYLGG